MHLAKLVDCTICMGPTARSVFISDCVNCKLVLACQQLRVHTTTNSDFYLHVTSRAIIEDCSGLGTSDAGCNFESVFGKSASIPRSPQLPLGILFSPRRRTLAATAPHCALALQRLPPTTGRTRARMTTMRPRALIAREILGTTWTISSGSRIISSRPTGGYCPRTNGEAHASCSGPASPPPGHAAQYPAALYPPCAHHCCTNTPCRITRWPSPSDSL